MRLFRLLTNAVEPDTPGMQNATFPLTPTLSLGERANGSRFLVNIAADGVAVRHCGQQPENGNSALDVRRPDAAKVRLPLPLGEGWGEGEGTVPGTERVASKRSLEILHLILTCIVLIGAGCQKAAQSSAPPPRMVAQVIAVPAKSQTVSETLSLVGSVAANEMVEVKSEIDGTVQEINFKEGERVEKGRLLVKLDDSKLIASAAEAEASFKLAKSTLERSKQLYERTLISPQEYDQVASQFQVAQATVELKRSLLKDTRIVAPFAGVVGTRAISPGQVISKNTPITWLVDLDPVKVEINIPERFLSQLKIGQTIELIVSAFPNRKFKGELFFIAPQVDPATRTAMVKAKIPNPELELKGGMFANLDLTLKVRENSVVIPESALAQLQEGGRASVFVVDQNQTAQMRQVKLGTRMPGQVEILEGIKPGEMVITEGLQKIGPGAPVRLAQEEGKSKT